MENLCYVVVTKNENFRVQNALILRILFCLLFGLLEKIGGKCVLYFLLFLFLMNIVDLYFTRSNSVYLFIFVFIFHFYNQTQKIYIDNTKVEKKDERSLQRGTQPEKY